MSLFDTPPASAMDDGLALAATLGHTMGPVDAAGFGRHARSTCTSCGAAVIVPTGFAYGSAVFYPCKET